MAILCPLCPTSTLLNSLTNLQDKGNVVRSYRKLPQGRQWRTPVSQVYCFLLWDLFPEIGCSLQPAGYLCCAVLQVGGMRRPFILGDCHGLRRGVVSLADPGPSRGL